MLPLVSILIPSYNAQEWIADTIQSARAQTWGRKEIIIVDDGSKDQTLSVAREFASKEVSIHSQENQGAAAARNKAYSLCQGNYIQWLDADDLLAPDKIEKQMQALGDSSDKTILLSSAWGRFIRRAHKAKFIPSPLWCDLSPAEWLIRKLEGNVFMQTATWLTSRELAEKAGPWDTRMMGDDDGEYFCRVKLHCSSIKFVAGSKVFYRMPQATNWSYVGRSSKQLEALLLSMRLHIGYLRSMEDTGRVRAASIKFLQTALPLYSPHRLDLVKEMEQMATELGGRLEPLKIPAKYLLIQKCFGCNAAKRSQLFYNRWKTSFLHTWDKTLFNLERRNLGR